MPNYILVWASKHSPRLNDFNYWRPVNCRPSYRAGALSAEVPRALPLIYLYPQCFIDLDRANISKNAYENIKNRIFSKFLLYVTTWEKKSYFLSFFCHFWGFIIFCHVFSEFVIFCHFFLKNSFICQVPLDSLLFIFLSFLLFYRAIIKLTTVTG